ncbi:MULTISPECIES: type I toxin-antitoxin system Ibs family toxin [Klebsiella]|nr:MULTISPECIES: type I toxin-antitoxin system Ibs family toxin [Klebsiella]EKZ9670408.1 type I toxin-antitoxin system Ibs family toxin [Klebsiella aerogenes]ELT7619758.1 type I toxin-antitoxin system Ibs family toxin [Klebsiella aerogenes]ELY3086949.1 type I toxin-antitoxin system Ibs family toxin [Klebsiella aerogenes]MDA3989685.1 type I toxin-antitoxin system Ibs family toxin [Klebsiella aerogenes]MDQ8582596.1 type I toxin-antitoxin system Ibs family toxin [Klebsiella aerogenes]
MMNLVIILIVLLLISFPTY